MRKSKNIVEGFLTYILLRIMPRRVYVEIGA